MPVSYEKEPECNKATELYVEVQTDLGPARYTVPATTKAVLEDPHAEEWLAADQKGCDVLTLAGNPLVREKDARAQGHTVIRSVVQRKYKIKHDTKRLAKVDPRKSRINVDGHQVKMMRQQAGQPGERVGPHAEIADDTLLKVQWSERSRCCPSTSWSWSRRDCRARWSRTSPWARRARSKARPNCRCPKCRRDQGDHTRRKTLGCTRPSQERSRRVPSAPA